MLAKQIWNIAVNKETLWIQWVHTEKLKGKSIWEIAIEAEDSWGWKNLLKIRDKIKNNVKYQVKNGKFTTMWYDNWSDMGPLIQYNTYRDIYDARFPINVKVGDMIQNGAWKWPQEWYEKFPLITSIEVPNIVDDDKDRVVWLNKKGEEADFSAKAATNVLCIDSPKVSWWRLIWYS